MYEADALLRLIEPRLAELGMSQADLGAAAFGTRDNSAIQGMKKGSVPSIDRVAAIARALGFDCYFGPPRDRPLQFEEPPSGAFAQLRTRPDDAGISWHRLVQAPVPPPLAFSTAWLAQHGLDPLRHHLVPIGPAASAASPATVAIVDSSAPRKDGPAPWALRNRAGDIALVQLQFGGGRTLILPNTDHAAVRFLNNGTTDPNVLGRVLWTGALTDP